MIPSAVARHIAASCFPMCMLPRRHTLPVGLTKAEKRLPGSAELAINDSLTCMRMRAVAWSGEQHRAGLRDREALRRVRGRLRAHLLRRDQHPELPAGPRVDRRLQARGGCPACLMSPRTAPAATAATGEASRPDNAVCCAPPGLSWQQQGTAAGLIRPPAEPPRLLLAATGAAAACHTLLLVIVASKGACGAIGVEMHQC